MQKEKRVGFLLVVTLFLLILIPSVFALFESIYYTLISPVDLQTLYYAWQTWIDASVFFLIFASIARIAYTRIYGEKGEEPPGATGLYLGIGLFASLGLTLLERRMGWSLLNFGPIVLFVMILVFMVLIYQFLTKKDKLAIGPAILFLLLALILTSVLFPNLFGYFYGIPILRDILGWVFLIGVIAGVIALLLWLTNLFGAGGGGGAGGGEGGREGSGLGNAIGRRLARMIEPRPRGPEEPTAPRMRVRIEIYPDINQYQIGQTITLRANIRRGRVFGGPAQGRFVCNWFVNGIQLRERDPVINYQIPQDIINQPQQDILISVVVQDLDNPTSQAEDRRTITIVAQLPNLVITQPVDTRNTRDLRAPVGQALTFSYIIEVTGAAPANLANVGWAYLPGRLSGADLQNIRTPAGFRQLMANSVLIAQGNNMQVIIGQGQLARMQPGIYTIIAVAQDNNGREYILPFNQQLLIDHFFLEIVTGPGPYPPQPQPQGNQPQFFLNIYREINRRRQAHSRGQGNIPPFSANLNDIFIFEPDVVNDNITNYNIDITGTNLHNRDNFRFNRRGRPPIARLQIRANGTKTINCVFRRNNNIVATVTATINVGAQPGPGPYPPPPPQQQQQAQPGPQQTLQPYFEIIDAIINRLALRADNTTPYGPHTIRLTRSSHGGAVRLIAGIATPGININNYTVRWTILDLRTGQTGTSQQVQATLPINFSGTAELTLEIIDNTNAVVGRINVGLEFILPNVQPPYLGGGQAATP